MQEVAPHTDQMWKQVIGWAATVPWVYRREDIAGTRVDQILVVYLPSHWLLRCTMPQTVDPPLLIIWPTHLWLKPSTTQAINHPMVRTAARSRHCLLATKSWRRLLSCRQAQACSDSIVCIPYFLYKAAVPNIAMSY